MISRTVTNSDFVSQDRVSRPGHEPPHVVQVMRRREGHGDGFVRPEQVVEVRDRVFPAQRARARLVRRLDASACSRLATLNRSPPHRRASKVSSVPCRAFRVGNVLSNVSTPWRTAPRMEPTSPMPSRWFGRSAGNRGMSVESRRRSSAVSFPSDPPMANPSNGSERCMPQPQTPQRFVHAAVNHAVHRLVADVPKVLPKAPRLPPVAQVHAPLERVARGPRSVRDQLVERDDDVGAEFFLRGDARLGRQRDRAPVAVASEQRAVLVRANQEPLGALLFRRAARFHLLAVRVARAREREDLEAAAVGDDGRVAADEAMQPAGAGDDVGAGLEHEVVRVREHQVHARVRERLVRDRLQGAGVPAATTRACR